VAGSRASIAATQALTNPSIRCSCSSRSMLFSMASAACPATIEKSHSSRLSKFGSGEASCGPKGFPSLGSLLMSWITPTMSPRRNQRARENVSGRVLQNLGDVRRYFVFFSDAIEKNGLSVGCRFPDETKIVDGELEVSQMFWNAV